MPGRNQTLMRTRCPACSTVFRVTSDQLRAKAGKVRCGYCQAVFNAFDELIDETRPAAVTPTPDEEQINLDAATTEYAPDEPADAIVAAEHDEAVLIPDSETGQETDEAETAVTPEAEPEIEVAGEDEQIQDEHPDAVPEEPDSDAGEPGEIDPSGMLTAAETEPPSAQVVEEKPEEATHAAREAGLDQHFAMAYVNLGVALDKKGQITEAILYYQRALNLDQKFVPAYFNLGNALSMAGRLDEAELCYRKALEVNPAFSSSHSALLLLLNNNPHYTAQKIFDEHREFSRQHARGLPSQFVFPKKKQTPGSRIRVGYVSPDFRRNSVAYIIEPVIASHSRDFFEIFCYSNVLIEDAVTLRMRKYSDQGIRRSI